MKRAERIAALLLEARSGGALVDAAREPGPADLEEVYRVQDLVLRALGGEARPGAWKAIPPRPGTPPAASPVPQHDVVTSPARVPARGAFLGVEAEIAFRLGADLEAEEALVAIESCATRLAGWEGAPLLWKIADFQSNAALVAGSGTRAWRAIDFSAQRFELIVNGKPAKEGRGGHPAGDPSTLLPWMRAHCATRGGLRPGELVTTGSWVGIVAARPGDDIVARFPGIGEARLRL